MSKKVEKRDALMMIATGQQRVGKTYQTTKFIDQYVKDNPKNGRKGNKVLIFDTNMEYTQYKTLHPKDVARFTKHPLIEVRRILPFNDDKSIMSTDDKLKMLVHLLYNFARGLLVLEDINTYLIGAIADDVIGKITTLRHTETDLVLHYQSAAAVPPRMWQNGGIIRLHKQQDTIDRYKGRIPYYELLKIAEYLVHEKYFNGDNHFFCYVSGNLGYVRGNFTKEDITSACRKYAEAHSVETSSLTKRYKASMSATAAYEKAVNEVTEELIKKYYR